MNDIERELGLGDYIRLVRRRWRLISLIFALGIALAVLYTQSTSRVYHAQSSVLIRNTQNESLFPGAGGADTLLLRETTAELQFVKGDGFRDAVSARVNVPVRLSASIRSVSDIERVPGASGVIILTATADSVGAAVGVVNAAAETYVELRHVDDSTEANRQLEGKQAELDELLVQRVDLEAPLIAINAKIATASGDQLGALLNESNQEERKIAGELSRLDSKITKAQQTESDLASVLLALDDQESAARVLTRATPGGVASSSGLARNIALSAIAALIVAIASVQIAESLDDNLSDLEEIERRLKAPVLGSVPELSRDRKQKADPMSTHFSNLSVTESESYRAIRTSLRFLSIDQPLKVVQITSSLESEGKSLTAVNLASAFAAEGDDVVVVDADLRRPAVHEKAGVDNKMGVSDLLADLTTLDEVIRKSDSGLSVVTAGRNPPNPADLLGGSRFRAMLQELSEQFDLVVVDSPPVLPVIDSRVVAARVDAVLMVVEDSKTPGDAAESAAELLRASHVNIAGVVVNRAAVPKAHYGYVASGYGDTDFSPAKIADKWDSAPPSDSGAKSSPTDNVVDLGRDDPSNGGRSATR